MTPSRKRVRRKPSLLSDYDDAIQYLEILRLRILDPHLFRLMGRLRRHRPTIEQAELLAAHKEL